jgi:hypothetical protein
MKTSIVLENYEMLIGPNYMVNKKYTVGDMLRESNAENH